MTDNLTEDNLEVPEELNSPEDVNEVRVQMRSGATHEVRYVIRHPRRDWVFAQKGTGSRETATGPAWESNDLVFHADAVESIESDEVSLPDALGKGSDSFFFRVHHSEPVDNLPIVTEVFRGFINDGPELEKLMDQRRQAKEAAKSPETTLD